MHGMFKGPVVTYFSYGYHSPDTKYQKNFHDEDTLVDLIKEKSGLINEHIKIRAATNVENKKVDIQFEYQYENNVDQFINAMKTFLEKGDHGTQFDILHKTTAAGYPPNPVFTFNLDKVKDLISDLKLIAPQPVNPDFLQGDLKLQYSKYFCGVCM